MSKEQDPDLSMEEIDRKIEEMPDVDLRDPKNRKKSSVNIDDLVKSMDLEAKMIAAMEEFENSDPPEEDDSEPD